MSARNFPTLRIQDGLLQPVGTFLDGDVRDRARLALERSWSGLVMEAFAPAETRLIQESVQKWGAELMLRLSNQGDPIDALNEFLPLDAPMLIDVEFLIEMTRARFEFVHEVFPAKK